MLKKDKGLDSQEENSYEVKESMIGNKKVFR
jgi:hypothetical protein